MRRAPAAGAGLVALAPAPAAAHGMLQGVGDFYAGLLHPLIVPAEALALVAVGLLLATSGRAACRLGLPALALGLGVGLAAGRSLPGGLATPALLAVAFAAALTVTAGLRLPPPLAAALALAGGIAVGVDADPEAPALAARLLASGATALGAAALVTIVIGLALGRERHWQHVALRIAGSWITACAILYFTWLLTAAPASAAADGRYGSNLTVAAATGAP